jgi:hypothetical protein
LLPNLRLAKLNGILLPRSRSRIVLIFVMQIRVAGRRIWKIYLLIRLRRRKITEATA